MERGLEFQLVFDQLQGAFEDQYLYERIQTGAGWIDIDGAISGVKHLKHSVL